MSAICLYLQVPVYLQQYLNHHFGDPIVFDRTLPMNKLIKLFIERQPSDVPIRTVTDNDVAIAIPDQSLKPPEYWNYLPPVAEQALLESIEATFDLNFYNEMLQIMPCGVKVMTAIRSWARLHGIDIEYDNTLKQKFYRIRDKFEKQGINIKKKTRCRD